ncbi:Fur-regulated basic protein FbpA [Bacillus nitratireducens]|nr:Fur-regulated basic protein FbpA [Bacillus nitratireducens]QUG86989.1 Fur-regulated basic protein FbpA [Bacillus nitratireducens]
MEQDVLINKLIDNHIFKLPDGHDLFGGSCEELALLLKGAGMNEFKSED